MLSFTTPFITSSTTSPPSCGLYGSQPCPFLPAPPGQTPSCARLGKTYCMKIDNYPTYLIKHLVHKWGYEAKHLLVDETWDDFKSVAWHETTVFYDPTFILPQRNHNHKNNNGKDISGYNYETPSYGKKNNNVNTNYDSKSSTKSPSYHLYRSSNGPHINFNANGVSSFGSSRTAKSTPNNPTLWLKRFVRDLSKNNAMTLGEIEPPIIDTTDETKFFLTKSISAHDVSLNIDLWNAVGLENNKKSRTKRQSSGRTSLCQTTSQFITPQAALNSKGNWMFVVNDAGTARQRVKAELCSSDTCNNLCQLPNGYNSRCEQKFIQKRLVALQGNGQNLYTDTFWFPSCCVCTISAN